MSYNPETGLVYIPTIEMPGAFSDKKIDLKAWRSPSFRISMGVDGFVESIPANIGSAALLAWDPVQQKKAWSVPLPENWNPGTATTAGNLVFQGRADGEFLAYDARSGEALWSTNLGSGISAPPVTYMVDGVQYVSLLVGWGGALPAIGGELSAQHGWAYKAHPRRLFTFALGAKVAVPSSPPPLRPTPLDVAGFEVNEALAAEGEVLYSEVCVLCHGGGVVSGGKAPDLRASAYTTDWKVFDGVVRDGRQELGMPRFRDLSVVPGDASLSLSDSGTTQPQANSRS